MSPIVAFLVPLLATAVAIAVTAALGRLARRRAHIASALTTVALLAWTIVAALRLGRAMWLPPALLLVHRVFANLATLVLVAVIATGIGLYRREDPARRMRHRVLVALFAGLTACALMTGTWLLLGARPRLPEAPAVLAE